MNLPADVVLRQAREFVESRGRSASPRLYDVCRLLIESHDAVTDALIVDCIYSAEHDANPRKAVTDLIVYESQLALDPRVSKQARELIERELAQFAGFLSVHLPELHKVVMGRLAEAIQLYLTASHGPSSEKSDELPA